MSHLHTPYSMSSFIGPWYHLSNQHHITRRWRSSSPCFRELPSWTPNNELVIAKNYKTLLTMKWIFGRMRYWRKLSHHPLALTWHKILHWIDLWSEIFQFIFAEQTKQVLYLIEVKLGWSSMNLDAKKVTKFIELTYTQFTSKKVSCDQLLRPIVKLVVNTWFSIFGATTCDHSNRICDQINSWSQIIFLVEILFPLCLWWI